MDPGPFPPQYEPSQVAAVESDEIKRHRLPTTPLTWLVAAMLAIGVTAWLIAAALKTFY